MADCRIGNSVYPDYLVTLQESAETEKVEFVSSQAWFVHRILDSQKKPPKGKSKGILSLSPRIYPK